MAVGDVGQVPVTECEYISDTILHRQLFYEIVSETESGKFNNIMNEENNCIPSVNAENTAMCVAVDSTVPFFEEMFNTYSCFSLISEYSRNSAYVDSGIPSVSIK